MSNTFSTGEHILRVSYSEVDFVASNSRKIVRTGIVLRDERSINGRKRNERDTRDWGRFIYEYRGTGRIGARPFLTIR